MCVRVRERGKRENTKDGQERLGNLRREIEKSEIKGEKEWVEWGEKSASGIEK